MAKLDNVKRIVKEDYDNKYHGLIDKLAFVLNSFMEQVTAQLNGNLDFSNLNRNLVTFKITVDSTGAPKGDGLVRTDVLGVKGATIIKATNKTTTSLFPTTQPFLSFTSGPNSQSIKITNISGLQADNKYELVVEFIG